MITTIKFSNWFVAESVASRSGKLSAQAPYNTVPPRSQASRSVFLSPPPQSSSRLFTLECRASCIDKCVTTEDTNQKRSVSYFYIYEFY